MEAAGRVLMVGLQGPDLEFDERRRLERLAPGGVILFRRNLDTPDRLIALVAELAGVLAAPRLIAIDQEGGRVNRLADWVGDGPTAARLAEAAPEATHRWGLATGRGLHALGFNLDFAPVVDLCGADSPNGIGDRSFGRDPDRTTERAGAFLAGLQAERIAGCLKHFPGLGDTPVDSHERLPVCDRDRATLESADLAPFARLGDHAACVMVGHAYYPALESVTGTPATLSHAVVTGLLRDSMGFRGLVVSDDLEMGAVAPLDQNGRAAVMAIAAGCDLLPYCSDLDRAEQARAALETAASDDSSFHDRLRNAARSVRNTAARWPAPRPDDRAWTLASEAWKRVATLA